MIARLAGLATPLLAKLVIGLGIAVAVLTPLAGWLTVKLIQAGGKCDARIQVAEATRKGEIATAIEQGKAEALRESRDAAVAIAMQARIDETALFTDLAEIAERGQIVKTVYRDRVSSLPAPTCAPGRDRVEAANAIYRGESR